MSVWFWFLFCCYGCLGFVAIGVEGQGSGRVIRTIDAGQTWELLLNDTTTVSFEAVAIASTPWDLNVPGKTNSKLLMAGSAGTILATSPDVNGSIWGRNFLSPRPRKVLPPTVSSFMSLCFFNASQAVVVGALGVAYRSDDAGLSWTKANRSAVSLVRDLNSVTCTSVAAVAVGNVNTVLRSTDLGSSWEEQSVSGSTINATNFYGVASHNSTVVVVGQAGTIIHSSDSGSSWVNASSAATQNLYCVEVLQDGQTALAGGGRGTLLRSTDSGLTWAQLPSPVVTRISNVRAVSLTFIAACSRDIVLLSTNAGVTWQVSKPISSVNYITDLSVQLAPVLRVPPNLHMFVAQSADEELSKHSFSLGLFNAGTAQLTVSRIHITGALPVAPVTVFAGALINPGDTVQVKYSFSVKGLPAGKLQQIVTVHHNGPQEGSVDVIPMDVTILQFVVTPYTLTEFLSQWYQVIIISGSSFLAVVAAVVTLRLRRVRRYNAHRPKRYHITFWSCCCSKAGVDSDSDDGDGSWSSQSSQDGEGDDVGSGNKPQVSNSNESSVSSRSSSSEAEPESLSDN